MKQFCIMNFDDASFQIETMVIAAHRANYMFEHVRDEYPTIEEALAGTVKLFEDEEEIADWAAFNMQWSDLAGQAMMIEAKGPARILSSCPWTFLDEVSAPEPIKPGPVDDVPLGILLSNLIAQGGTCSVIQMGEPSTVAVAVIQGDPEVIAGYVAVLQQFTRHVKAHPDGVMPPKAVERPRIPYPH